MGVLPALFLDVAEFSRTHRIGKERVLYFMNIGKIPEVRSNGGKRYIDMVELLKRMDDDQFDLYALDEKGKENG